MDFLLTALISGVLGTAAWLLVNLVGKPILDLKDKIKQALEVAENNAFVRPRSYEDDVEFGRPARVALREIGASLKSTARTQNPLTALYVRRSGYDLEAAAALLLGLANCVHDEVPADAPKRRNNLDLLHVKLRASSHLSIARVSDLLKMEKDAELTSDNAPHLSEDNGETLSLVHTSVDGKLVAKGLGNEQVTKLKLRLGVPDPPPRDRSSFSVNIILEVLGDLALRDCRVSLQKVELYDEKTGTFQPVSHSNSSLPLGWLRAEFLERVKFDPKLLTPGEHAIEFISARLHDKLAGSEASSPAYFVVAPRTKIQDRARQFWERGKYRFTVIAASTDSVASDALVIIVNWTGLPKDMTAETLPVNPPESVTSPGH
jgi:hypothetical protein